MRQQVATRKHHTQYWREMQSRVADVLREIEPSTSVDINLRFARNPTRAWEPSFFDSQENIYCSLAYSAFACFRIGMEPSAPFHRVKKLVVRTKSFCPVALNCITAREAEIGESPAGVGIFYQGSMIQEFLIFSSGGVAFTKGQIGLTPKIGWVERRRPLGG
jgi:hypothetical protein